MIFIIYFTVLFLLNVLAFGLYANDKHRAYYSKSRIPEAVLLGLAVVGGAYGSGAGMLLFSHKTRHIAFCITVPIFILIWTAASIFIISQVGIL